MASQVKLWCIVPKCTSSSSTTPGKHFIDVPREKKERKLWLDAMRRPTNLTSTSHVYCCEDHFNVRER